MELNFYDDNILKHPKSTALIYDDQKYSFEALDELRKANLSWIQQSEIGQGDVVIIKGDYSPLTISVLLALINNDNIIIPLSPKSFDKLQLSINNIPTRWILDTCQIPPKLLESNYSSKDEPFFKIIRDRSSPGLVLFTSGSSGTPKAVVHDFKKLLEKFNTPSKTLRTINFLLFDHWGGLNTLFHCLSNASPIIIPKLRSPEYICELIEKESIELLPVTPGFLNMLVISNAYKRYDLSSLKLITYGAEPMPQYTLDSIVRIFPNVMLKQTYGMIEIGVLRVKSKNSKSLWIKLGGEGYQTRIVDNKLEIKAESSMLGYLNADSPFTEDGYMKTGDLVEFDGEWMRILGRESDLINVGGEKVYPLEVEQALFECDGVIDVKVYGIANPILGKVVCADVVINDDLNQDEMRKKIKSFSALRLDKFKIPMKINFVQKIEVSDRLKKIRI